MIDPILVLSYAGWFLLGLFVGIAIQKRATIYGGR